MEGLPKYVASTIFTPKSKSRLIGVGSFGSVLLCRLPNKENVAVKCFTVSAQGNEKEQMLQKLLKEAVILLKLVHPNIVKLCGITEWKDYVGIIMEYMAGGNLDSFLQNSCLEKIGWPLLFRISLNICEGIQGLHSYKPKKCLVHGDIKPENILLTADLIAKLADFGSISMFLLPGASKTSTDIPPNRQHTPLYTAPEFLKDCNIQRTSAMDIYSFGMVLYEIITRRRIFDSVKIGYARVLQVIIDRGQRPDESLYRKIKENLLGTDQEIFTILSETMKRSWSQNPDDRPSAAEISRDLHTHYVQFDTDSIEVMVGEVVGKMNMKPIYLNRKIPMSALDGLSSLLPESSQSGLLRSNENPSSTSVSFSHKPSNASIAIQQFSSTAPAELSSSYSEPPPKQPAAIFESSSQLPSLRVSIVQRHSSATFVEESSQSSLLRSNENPSSTSVSSSHKSSNASIANRQFLSSASAELSSSDSEPPPKQPAAIFESTVEDFPGPSFDRTKKIWCSLILFGLILFGCSLHGIQERRRAYDGTVISIDVLKKINIIKNLWKKELYNDATSQTEEILKMDPKQITSRCVVIIGEMLSIAKLFQDELDHMISLRVIDWSAELCENIRNQAFRLLKLKDCRSITDSVARSINDAGLKALKCTTKQGQ